jgi:hypothetical protein
MSTLKTINLQHPTAATANITLSNTGGIALNGSVSGGGMDLITPTSVAGTGVTFSGGLISFSAATTISINGCFTSAYDVYSLVLRLTGISVDTQIAIRLRALGVDDSAANYDWAGAYNGGATGNEYLTGQTSWPYVMTTDAGNNNSFYGGIFNIMSPALTTQKVIIGKSIGRDFSGLLLLRSIGGSKNITTACDGVSLITSGITGQLRIYGLRNS